MNAPLNTKALGICPCCRQSTADVKGPLVDPIRSTVSYQGHVAQIERGLMTIVASKMAEVFPDGVTGEDLVWHIWRGNRHEPEDAIGVVRATVYRLRKRLREFPVIVPAGYGNVVMRYSFTPSRRAPWLTK